MSNLELSRRWVALGLGGYAAALVLVVGMRIEASPAGMGLLIAVLGAITAYAATLLERPEGSDDEASWSVSALVLAIGTLLALRVFTAAAFSEDLTRFAVKLALGVLLAWLAYSILKRWA